MFLFELYLMTHAFYIKRGETSVFTSKNNSSLFGFFFLGGGEGRGIN